MFCIYCGAEISPAAEFCGICANSQRVPFDGLTPLCAYCQKGNPLQAIFCRHCGRRLREEESVPAILNSPADLPSSAELTTIPPSAEESTNLPSSEEELTSVPFSEGKELASELPPAAESTSSTAPPAGESIDGAETEQSASESQPVIPVVPQIEDFPTIPEPISELGHLQHVEPDSLPHSDDLSSAALADASHTIPIPEEAPQAGIGEVSHSGPEDIPHAGQTDAPHTDTPDTDAPPTGHSPFYSMPPHVEP